MFFKIGVLERFCKIHRKISVLKSLNKVVDLKARKEAPTQVFPREYYEIFTSTFFTEHLRWLLVLF